MSTNADESISNLAIMFADVSGSSALYKQQGNVLAKRSIDKALNLMREITQRNQGVVVKTIGDEVMARFSTPENACAAAAAIQQYCHNQITENQVTEHDSLAIRIGMDFGHTLLDGDDVFGDTVNDAAYVSQIARPNQIVITQALVDALPPHMHKNCQEFDRINIKGEESKSLIYRFVWERPFTTEEENATTVVKINHITQKINTRRLQLDFNRQVFAITPGDVPFIIGRDHRKSHLHVDSSLASRDHCHIVLRRGKFVLVDHSTNGTYVKTPDHPEIYLRREEFPLQGEGTISIGRRAHQDKDLTISYKT